MARDSKYRSLGEEPRPFAYVPVAQQYDAQVWILARTTGPNVLPAMREVIQRLGLFFDRFADLLLVEGKS